MRLLFFKPKPQFQLGDVVRLSDGPNNQELYMGIAVHTWLVPEGKGDKEWVFAGPIFEYVPGEGLVQVSYGTGFLKSSLRPIRRLRYTG